MDLVLTLHYLNNKLRNMKKNIIYIALLFFSFTIISCEEELEIFDTNTLSYSGTYFYELYDDTSELYWEYTNAQSMMIYNTSDNVVNEIWFENFDAGGFHIKSKFFLSGTSESFQSSSMDFDNLPNNEPAIEAPSTKPTGLGETVTVDRKYIRNAMEDGRITINGETTVSGNPVDAISITFKMLSGTVSFTSYSVPVEERDDPEVEQFDWLYESAAYDSALDENWTFSGHRKNWFRRRRSLIELKI